MLRLFRIVASMAITTMSIFLLLLVEPPAGAATAKLSTIVLGVDGNFSGPGSSNVQIVAFRDTYTAWTKWVNSTGGLSGHPVKVIIKDDAANPATALSNVEELVLQDHAIAFPGLAASLTEPAFESFLDLHKVPAIGGEDEPTQWTTNAMFFPVQFTFNVLLYAEAQAALKAGGKGAVVANVACTENPQCAAVGQAVDPLYVKAGLKPGGNFLVSMSTVDFTATCVAMKNAGVSVVTVISGQPTAIGLEKGCKAQGFVPKYVAAQADNAILATGVPTYLTSEGFPWTGNYPETATYRMVMKKYGYAAQEGSYSTETWGGLAMLQAASKHLPKKNVTSQDILDGLYALPATTLGGLAPGPVKYHTGQPTGPLSCGWLMEAVNGKWTAPLGMKGICIPPASAS